MLANRARDIGDITALQNHLTEVEPNGRSGSFYCVSIVNQVNKDRRLAGQLADMTS